MSANSGPPIKLVLAIDLGTSRTGFAWALVNKPNDIICEQHNEQVGAKEPTVLLLNRTNLQCIAFGHAAQMQYEEATSREQNQWWYFTNYKMALYDADMNARSLTVFADNDVGHVQPIPFKVVMGETLKYIRGRAIERILELGREPEAVEWILTVPAVWTEAGKAIMRECAIDYANFPKTRLRLALESEAAALCAKDHLKQLQSGEKRGDVIKTPLQDGRNPKHALVVDLGGGTADFTMHAMDPIATNVSVQLAPAVGLPIGGQNVDKAFVENILVRLFGPLLWAKFMHTYPQGKTHLLKTFESIKDRLKPISPATSNIVFRFPLSVEWLPLIPAYFQKMGEHLKGLPWFDASLIPADPAPATSSPPILLDPVMTVDEDFYVVGEATPPTVLDDFIDKKVPQPSSTSKDEKTGQPSLSFSSIMFVNNTLKIPQDLLVEQYKHSIGSITDKILECLSKNKSIGSVYLVGGFMRQPIVKAHLTEVIEYLFKIVPVIPPYPSNAVMKGAVMYGLCPSQITKRRLPFSIGLAVKLPPSNPSYARLKARAKPSEMPRGEIGLLEDVITILYKAGDVVLTDGYRFPLRNTTPNTLFIGKFFQTSKTEDYLRSEKPEDEKEVGSIEAAVDKNETSKRYLLRIDLKDTEFRATLEREVGKTIIRQEQTFQFLKPINNT